MSLDGGAALDNQLLGWLLLVKGNKAKVLGSILPRLVHRADNLHYSSKLVERSIRAIDLR